jgi:hypothetical protein
MAGLEGGGGAGLCQLFSLGHKSHNKSGVEDGFFEQDEVSRLRSVSKSKYVAASGEPSSA